MRGFAGPAAPASLLLLLLSLPGGGAAALGPDEEPFPTPTRSVILRKEKTVYLVEGRVRIPAGVEVSCQKDIHIRSKGKEPAVIEVEGSFKAHGVTDREIIFEGVTVEPQPEFGKIHLDSCIFRNGGGLATPREKPAYGTVMVQLCRFREGAVLDLEMSGDSVQVLDTSLGSALRLRGADRDGKPNRIKAVVRASNFYGLDASNLADLTVRINEIRGEPAVLRNCDVLIFDGNKVESPELSFRQSEAGRFGRTQVMKCDLYSKRILFHAPADPKKTDTVVMDKCWFEGKTDRESLASRIVDADDDPENNVRVVVRNPLERPLELAGPVNR